jgi:two-component system sensor histidine kinase UhpB
VPASPTDVWFLFLAGAATLIVILSGLVAALVINHRRVQELHRDFARRLLAAQEEERAWVAREVHDDALQRLALVGHELDRAGAAAGTSGKGDAAQGPGTLRGIREEVDDLSYTLRQLAHRLHPSLLEKAGLAPALNQLAGDVARAQGLEVTTDLPPAESPVALAPERALAIFRIAQEALRNAGRHSGASQAHLSLRPTNGVLELTVSDRGRGFSPGTGPRAGIGLASMQERARNAGGALEVVSRPGGGTTVIGRFPLPLGSGAGTGRGAL